MASGSGKFESFDPHSGQKWTVYYQRFLFHCKTRKYGTDAEQKAELLSCASEEFFEYIQGICRRELHDESLTFERICTTLEDHLAPKPNEIVSAGQFHARNQQPGETVAEYLGELKKLARRANFSNFYDRAMRDRFVLGLADADTQAWLYRLGNDLELDKAVETALAVEASTGHVAATSGQGNGGINFVDRNRRPEQSKGRQNVQPANVTPCVRCGSNNHKAHECRFKDALCFYCGNAGHVERVCGIKKKEQQQQDGAGPSKKKGGRRVTKSGGGRQNAHSLTQPPTPGGNPAGTGADPPVSGASDGGAAAAALNALFARMQAKENMPPQKPPTLTVDKKRFNTGDMIRANCTVPAAYPAPNITWLLDDTPLSNQVEFYTESLQHEPAASRHGPGHGPGHGLGHGAQAAEEVRLDSVRSAVQITADRNKMVLSCQASQYAVYRQQSAPVVLQSEGAPKPAPVRKAASSGARGGHGRRPLASLLLLPLSLLAALAVPALGGARR